MQEIEFTKEDEYCIRKFGYNTIGDYENLKQLEDKEHLIVEELEYRLHQKENIIKEVREYIENHFLYHYGSDKKPIVFEDNYIQEIVDILDKENK